MSATRLSSLLTRLCPTAVWRSLDGVYYESQADGTALKRLSLLTSLPLLSSYRNNDPLIPGERGGSIVGCFKNQMDRLATHGISGNKHFSLRRSRIGDNYFIGIASYPELPPVDGNRIAIRIGNGSI